MTRQELKDRVFLKMAFKLADLATCPRRKVGCLLVSENGLIIGHGFNGVEPGAPHCIDVPCPGAGLPSGTGLEKCEAIHAEQNALIDLKHPELVHTVYVTTAPCITCVTQLGRTKATRIVFGTEYPHVEAKDRWLRKPGREWILLEKLYK